MTIATLAQYEAALKERVSFNKQFPNNTIVGYWNGCWDGLGFPPAASIVLGNTTSGLVPTDATAGAPSIKFGAGNGYITSIELTASLAAKYMIADRLFHVGTYASNGSSVLTAQPSFSSRIPGGTDYKGLQIWYEGASNGTGVQNVAVTYTDQSGNAGHTTGTVICAHAGFQALNSRMFQLPLAPGDSGVSKIESVTGSVATGGTFNVLVLRPLAMLRYPLPNNSVTYSLEQLGMPEVWSDSCLMLMQATDLSTSPPTTLEVSIEIASG